MTAKALWITGAAITTVVAVVATVFTVLAINNFGRFDQRIDAECAPLVVIAFRGSGEQNLTSGVVSNAGEPYRYGDSELVTNGWEGITLDGLFEQLSQTTYEGFNADQIPVIPIGPAGTSEPFGYEAISAVLEASSVSSALSYSGSSLLYSASRGAEAATHLISEYLEKSEGCPVLPKFIAVGYSQGAMAARHTAELNPESVLGVIKIGDPYQKPDAPGVRAGGASGIGIIRWKADEAQGEHLDAYYDARDLRSAFCHAGDPICEFSPVEGLFKLATGTYGDHLDYYSDAYPEEASEDALEIAKLAYERWLLALAAQEAGESIDWSEASAAAGNAQLRALSLSFAGTPTLFSAFSLDHLGKDMRYEFDLDGDGVFETESPDGTVWVTFDDDRTRTVGVRVTDPSGRATVATTTITPAPKSNGEIMFSPDGEMIDPAPPPAVTPAVAPAPEPVTPPAPRPPATVSRPVPAPAPAPAPGPAVVPPAPPVAPPAPPVDPPAPVDPPSTTDPSDPDEGTDRFRVSFPSVVYRGDLFEVSGTGFEPDTNYNLWVGDAGPMGEVRTDESGSFEGLAYIPDDMAAGTHELSVRLPLEDGDSVVFSSPLEVGEVPAA